MSNIPILRYGFAGDGVLDASKRSPIELTAPQAAEPSAPGPGVFMSPLRQTTIVPLAIVANNIAASQIMNGTVTLTAGTSALSAQLYGATVIDIGAGVQYDRAITITGAASGTAVPFTIVGYDMYNQRQTEVITGPTTATVTTNKCYRYIQSITTTGTTTSAFTIGTSDTIGLPVLVSTFDQFINLYYNNAGITATTGFTAADLTSPATTVTGAVRGKYALQSASDGTKRFTHYISIPIANINNMNTCYGVQPV